MALLKPAEKQTAYLKAGILGFAGSGKTFTASMLARGLALLEEQGGRKKPVAFFDTETGSDYSIDSFKNQGIEMIVAKTRAFSDLLNVVKEAESQASVLIIDSITHVWTELVDAYMHKKGIDSLAVWDWNPIKTEWRQFTDLYLCSKIHIILCGRAAFTYDEWINEKGKKEIIKTGTKMRVESDMGYEPSLLFEMERVQPETNPRKKKGSQWVHRATILKDRADLMNGTVIDNPSFKDFMPLIKALNLGGEHFVLDTSRTSDAMIQSPDYSYEDRKKSQKIFSEEIEGELTSAFPGTAKEEKKIKADILDVVFDSRSWTRICDYHPDRLREGLSDVKYLLTKVREADQLPEGNEFIPWLRGVLIKRADEQDQIPDFEAPKDEEQKALI
jgi:hypothetical protein